MPKEEKVTRNREERAAIAPTRSVKRLFSLAHERATRAIVSVALATALASCSPAVSQAQDTTPAKGKAEVAAVEKKAVTYETIADMKELQPYLDAAKDKLVTIKPGETKQVGSYSIKIDTQFSNAHGTQYEITTNNGTFETITLASLPQNTNILLLDMGSNHPYILGKVLVFTNNEEVRMLFFDKKANKISGAAIILEEGGMRPGPIETGFGVNGSGSLFVFNTPKGMRPGDVVIQGDLATDGSTGASFYIYDPGKPSGTLVASIAMR